MRGRIFAGLFLLHGTSLSPERAGERTYSYLDQRKVDQRRNYFLQGSHALRTEELKEAFGKDPDGFLRAGKRLGGVELLFGDKAFAITVLPRVPLAYLLWKESEEFPSQVNVLFDSTIQDHFSLDGIWCIVAEVSRRLLEAGEP